ncbi:MAG: sugar porter family MFS transporter [Saprospiraceae bacterium]|nr:sugar porter family MFS transporter [Saprospiraceae bacterium]
MKRSNVSIWTLSVALAGFLFGFDTVVISGANLPIKELWNTSPLFHGTFIMSMALWGTVIGALFGGIPTDRFGRKKTLFWIGVLYAISALGSALAPDPYLFSFFRFIGGLGVGASSVAVPIYLSEVSSAKERGGIVARYQFMIVFGIFIAFISNYLLKGVGGDIDWRLMLGVEAIPAIIYCILVLRVPNSPRWIMLKKHDEQGARKILESLGVEDVESSLAQIKSSTDEAGKPSGIFGGKYNFPLMLAFLLAFFNQLSGINFVLYYAPEILERAGLAAKESLGSSISIGAVNLIFTLLGMYLIDRAGRKQLMIWGSLGYILSLSMVGYAFFSGASSVFLLTFILVFIASHAIGQGAVIWVFISEIFPNKVRAYGQSWGTGTHWVFAALITLVTPLFLDSEKGIFKDNPWPIFAFFAGFMVLQLFFVLFMMPETKGKSLEELEQELSRS